MKTVAFLILFLVLSGCASRQTRHFSMESMMLSELSSVPLTPSYWEVVYNGNGRVEFDRQRKELVLIPKVPETPQQTFAALVVLKKLKIKLLQDFVVRIEVSNERQLRALAPNDWEVFWFFGNYRKSEAGTKEANYFILKPNSGAELGIAFDEVGQKFLKTDTSSLLKLPARDELILIKRGTSFRAYRNQILVLDYKEGDSEHKLYPHAGTFGLYSEDAQVRIHSFSYKAL